MSLLWSDGFEVDRTSTSFLMSYPGSAPNAYTVFGIKAGRFGGRCLKQTSTLAMAFAKTLSPGDATAILGFALCANKPLDGLVLFSIINPSGNVLSFTVNISPINGNYQLILKTGEKVLAETDYFGAFQWNYLEVKLNCVSGSLEFRVNEILRISKTNVGFAYPSWSGFYFSMAAYEPDGLILIDDLIVCDGTDVTSNHFDFQGDVTIESLVPVKDSNVFATPSPDHSRNDANGQLYLMLGGINLDGTGAPGDLPPLLQGPQNNRRIWAVGAVNWADLNAGINNTSGGMVYGGTNPAFGLEMGFMEQAQQFDGNTVNILKLALPGSALSKQVDPFGWDPTVVGGMFDALKSLTSSIKNWFSVAHCRVPAVIWGQGEIDAIYYESSTFYYYRLKALIAAVRDDLASKFGVDNEEVPFFIVDLHSSIPLNICPFRDTIREAHAKLASEMSSVYVINSDSVYLAPDDVSFSSAGYLDFGKSIFSIVKSKMPHYQLLDDPSEGLADSDLSYVRAGPGTGIEVFQMSPTSRTFGPVLGLALKADVKHISGFSGLQAVCTKDVRQAFMGAPIIVTSPTWKRYLASCPFEPLDRQLPWLPEDLRRYGLGAFLSG